MRRVLLAVVAIALLPGAGPAQSLEEHPRVAEALGLVEAWVSAKRDYDRLPGASVAVVHDQDVLWSGGFGFAHMDSERPADAKTLYSVCSISKLFTAVGVLQLRDAGELRLDDPVAEHLDWFEIGETYEGSGPVRVENVLTHSSGLPRESDYPYWTGPDHPFPTREAIVERVSQQDMLYPSDTYYQYSNLGLTLAGEVVTAASGVEFHEYVRTHILDPLGMEDTYSEHPDALRGAQFATGYSGIRRDGSRDPVPPYSVRGISPAAGFVSNVLDMSAFASWQFRALEHESDPVLAPNTLREMQRVHWVNPDWEVTRGLGFSVWRDEEKTFVGHGGYCPGYQSHFLMQTDERIATVFMTNTNGVNSRSFTQTAYDIVAPAILEALDAESEAEWIEPELKAFVGRYQSWLAGESVVLPWKGGLAVLSLPTDSPLDALTPLKHVEGPIFRRVRDNGELGEAFEFEVDESGEVTRVWHNSNFQTRVSDSMTTGPDFPR